jgi:MOSC domain-containing protein YiiM
MTGTIVALYLKPAHGKPMQPVELALAEDGMGLVGDASYGRGSRQVLIIEQETLEEFGLVSGQVRENITVRGISLAGLPDGTLLKAGKVLLEVTGDCAPCSFIEGMRSGLRQEIEGRRGTLFRVVEGGALRPGDTVHVE